MTDTSADSGEGPQAKAPSKLPLIIGVVLALVGGGGGFYAVQSGLLTGGGSGESHAADTDEGSGADTSQDMTGAESLGDLAFVEVPPLVVSLGPGADARHLRFRASLEVPKKHVAAVEAVTPRIQDVLNSYLRAVDVGDIEAPGALLRLRAQMLRRVQLVTGPGHVSDLLVLEFILS